MLDIFLVSLSELITPTGLALLLGASIIGLIIGTLPGLNVAMAVAILLPLTFSMRPRWGCRPLSRSTWAACRAARSARSC